MKVRYGRRTRGYIGILYDVCKVADGQRIQRNIILDANTNYHYFKEALDLKLIKFEKIEKAKGKYGHVYKRTKLGDHFCKAFEIVLLSLRLKSSKTFLKRIEIDD